MKRGMCEWEKSVIAPIRHFSAVFALTLTSCASHIDNSQTADAGAMRPAKPVFLKIGKTKGLPFPSIGRATEGRLLVSIEGCVYVEAIENLLIIWPTDAVYDERSQTFRTAGSGELRFGMNLTFTGTPVQPLKVSKGGGIKVPASCRRMLVLLVGSDGARRL